MEDISIVFSREVFDMAKTLQLYSGSLRLFLSLETILFLYYECDDIDFECDTLSRREDAIDFLVSCDILRHSLGKWLEEIYGIVTYSQSYLLSESWESKQDLERMTCGLCRPGRTSHPMRVCSVAIR